MLTTPNTLKGGGPEGRKREEQRRTSYNYIDTNNKKANKKVSIKVM